MIFKNKNDYSIIVYDATGRMLKYWLYVNGLYSASVSLDRLAPTWHKMFVYNRRTRLFMYVFNNGDYIPNKPR